MKASLNWLKRYVPIKSTPEELAEVLPMLGFEVDEVIFKGIPLLEHVVVGEIKSRQQHPDADRLGICQVQVSDNPEDIKQIVCGASNYKVGDRVPVALPGAILPGDFKIKKSKLRGVDSEGMMCSAKELGIGSDSQGLLILSNHPPLGISINDVLKDNDVILDLEKITANRGDCLSHIGLARELSAYYNIELISPLVPDYPYAFANQSNFDNNSFKGIEVKSPNCPLYTAWVIKGVTVKQSPEWLRKDLEAIGLRSVNNIVDITNWIMMDCGQPLHAFDLRKIKGKKLIVRQAQENEVIITLDQKKRTLDPSMTVIADEEKPLVVAGIMGSLDAEVDETTVDLVLESAYFDPVSIRHTSKNLNLSTDSAYRFVRDVNPKGVVDAARRAIKMILDIAGGELVSSGILVGKEPRHDREIEIDPNFVRERCGFDVENAVSIDIFKRLGFLVDSKAFLWKVIVPSFRADITRPIDLVEEFLRIYGTKNIPKSEVMVPGFTRNDDPIARFNHKVVDYLVGQHFDECVHYTLRQEKEINDLYGKNIASYCALDNPLTADHTHVRMSLLPGLWDTINFNQRNGNRITNIFETGRVIQVVNDKPYEVLSVGFAIISKHPHEHEWLKREAVDFYKVKGLILEIASIAGLQKDNIDFKIIENSNLWQNNQSAQAGTLENDKFQIHVGMSNLKLMKQWETQGTIFCGEIFLLPELLKQETLEKRQIKFEPFSTFPASIKDLGLVMDAKIPAETARKKLFIAAKKAVENKFHVEGVTIFDVYQGKGIEEGKKSIAFSIKFRAHDRTLKEEEIMDAFAKTQSNIISEGTFSIRKE